MTDVKRYAERDIMALDEAGGFYYRHIYAMTGESLHSKSDIAAELGHRDMQIEALQAENKRLTQKTLDQFVEIQDLRRAANDLKGESDRLKAILMPGEWESSENKLKADAVREAYDCAHDKCIERGYFEPEDDDD